MLSDLPPEIILELVTHLPLRDVLSLLSTCRPFHALTNDRSLWISVLNTARLSTPLACPPHTVLSRPIYTLSRLKEIALHNLKLEASWRRERPSPSRPTLTTNFSEPLDIIFNVQGTDIILLNFTESMEVVCWDKKAAKAFPFPAIPTGGSVGDVAAPCDSDGASTIAFITHQREMPFTRFAHVVTIFHDDIKATGIEATRTEIETRSAHFESIFVSEDMFGCGVMNDIDNHLTLTVCPRGVDARLSEDLSHLVDIHRLLNSDEVTLCFVYKGHIYNLLENGTTAQVQHFSRNTIRSGRFEECQIWHCDIPGLENSDPFSLMLPSTPFYGVGAVFVRWLGNEIAESTVTLAFLPCALTHLPDNGDNSPLGFDLPCQLACISGRPANAMTLVWMDHGGFNVTIVVETPDGPALKLVRYHPRATATTSVHDLEVPPFINLLELNTVCVDETAGTVNLIDAAGAMTTLYYT
ncbi:hypothetical protein C8F01DRAFT_1105510 [Mycena amicta]|nr:hypothetical protein C8F01DRAFT_1105510 [Mycena amicta]